MAKLSLKKLFKKKDGGTVVGNIFRKVTSGLADTVGLGSVVNALNPIPEAPLKVQYVAEQAISKAIQLPAVDSATAQNFASQAATQIIKSGGTEAEALKVASQVESAAQEPAQPVNSLTKKEVIGVLKDGLNGGKDAAIQSWLDKTDSGRETKNSAILGQVEKYAPLALAAGVLIWFLNKK